ncbi:hypothetical protein ACQ858_21890 [Variovorax ureilyticus]|uniref:hypothetical protein n=1 Tax=Variovorax ureilyticus TaxID=1836198 RepID=UPI003D66C2F1
MASADDDHIEFFGIQHEKWAHCRVRCAKGALILIAGGTTHRFGDKASAVTVAIYLIAKIMLAIAHITPQFANALEPASIGLPFPKTRIDIPLEVFA